jgi:chemotaxis protein MotB
LTAQLTDANTKIAALSGQIEKLSAALTEANGKIATLSGQIDQLTADLQKQQAANADLTAALNTAAAKIATLTTALCEATDKVVALTNRLDPYSQEFVIGLKGIFADNQNVFFDGNRVIVAAEVLFPTGSADLDASGRDTIMKVASFMTEFAPKLPPDVKWVLQVNGHTDLRPIKTRKFPSNWELSTARALSVVELLEDSVLQGHLAAAGFSQYQPLAPGNDPEVMRHNRRIEMEITDNGLPGVAPPEPAPLSCAAQP